MPALYALLLPLVRFSTPGAVIVAYGRRVFKLCCEGGG